MSIMLARAARRTCAELYRASETASGGHRHKVRWGRLPEKNMLLRDQRWG